MSSVCAVSTVNIDDANVNMNNNHIDTTNQSSPSHSHSSGSSELEEVKPDDCKSNLSASPNSVYSGSRGPSPEQGYYSSIDNSDASMNGTVSAPLDVEANFVPLSKKSQQHVFMVHVDQGGIFAFKSGDHDQYIPGPATVKMLSNNGSQQLPLHVPPGQFIQQVNEDSQLTHIYLSSHQQPISTIFEQQPAAYYGDIYNPAPQVYGSYYGQPPVPYINYAGGDGFITAAPMNIPNAADPAMLAQQAGAPITVGIGYPQPVPMNGQPPQGVAAESASSPHTNGAGGPHRRHRDRLQRRVLRSKIAGVGAPRHHKLTGSGDSVGITGDEASCSSSGEDDSSMVASTPIPTAVPTAYYQAASAPTDAQAAAIIEVLSHIDTPIIEQVKSRSASVIVTPPSLDGPPPPVEPTADDGVAITEDKTAENETAAIAERLHFNTDALQFDLYVSDGVRDGKYRHIYT